MYDIHFTENQFMIIGQLLKILNEYNEDEDVSRFDREDEIDDEDDDEERDEDFHWYDPDEDDERVEIVNEFNLEDDAIDDTTDFDEEYSLLLIRITEKLMQLSITFIIQYFPKKNDLHNPLTFHEYHEYR